MSKRHRRSNRHQMGSHKRSYALGSPERRQYSDKDTERLLQALLILHSEGIRFPSTEPKVAFHATSHEAVLHFIGETGVSSERKILECDIFGEHSLIGYSPDAVSPLAPNGALVRVLPIVQKPTQNEITRILFGMWEGLSPSVSA